MSYIPDSYKHARICWHIWRRRKRIQTQAETERIRCSACRDRYRPTGWIVRDIVEERGMIDLANVTDR